MKTQTFCSVWDAIEDTKANAEHMKLRSQLMMALDQFVKDNKFTQTQAAKVFGVTQPRISDLLRGGISKRGVVYGPMAEVTYNSLQYMTDADTKAMAVYLKSLGEGSPPAKESSGPGRGDWLRPPASGQRPPARHRKPDRP